MYLLLIPGFALYLYIGLVFSALNFDLPYGGRMSDRWRFFCYPLSTIGWWKRRTLNEFIDIGDTAVFPWVTLALVWPFKIVWNVATILVLYLLGTIKAIAMVIVRPKTLLVVFVLPFFWDGGR